LNDVELHLSSTSQTDRVSKIKVVGDGAIDAFDSIEKWQIDRTGANISDSFWWSIYIILRSRI